MVNENNWPVQEKSSKQEKLYFQLIQSSVISKKEFERYYQKIIPKLKSTFDASLLIDHLLSTIKMRKAFRNPKERAHLKCGYCGSKKDVKRYYSPRTKKQVMVCSKCDEQFVLIEQKSESPLNEQSLAVTSE